MSKLYRARSLLYRRQILQQNIRWKALNEIYKSYMLLHRSDLNISEEIRVDVLLFVADFLNQQCLPFFCSILMIFCRNCADFVENAGILWSINLEICHLITKVENNFYT